METHQLHIVVLFISFALALTVLIDGVTHLSLARSDFPNTDNGKVGWTNLMMYEITAPVLSLFGLLMHVLGLHLDIISYRPETYTEAMLLVIGSTAHVAAWLTIGSMWTACEINTMSVRKVASTTAGQPGYIIVNRGGPPFCPQHKFLDGGLSLEGPIPKIKVGLAWVLFILSFVALACACRSLTDAKHNRYMEENSTTGGWSAQGRQQTFEMDAYANASRTAKTGRLGGRGDGYETKI